MAALACRKKILLFSSSVIALSPLINNWNLKGSEFNRCSGTGCLCIREITHLDSSRARVSAQHSQHICEGEIEHAANPPECCYFIWGDLLHALFHPSKNSCFNSRCLCLTLLFLFFFFFIVRFSAFHLGKKIILFFLCLIGMAESFFCV